MKIKYSIDRLGNILVSSVDFPDETIYIQTDYDYPSLASTFGWVPCDKCNLTDGTVDCAHHKASEMIQNAYAHLKQHEGEQVEDPGYFEDRMVGGKTSQGYGTRRYAMKEANPFGTSLVVTAKAGEEGKSKEQKTSDLVKIHLQCIPALESAKDSLLEIASTTKDDNIKQVVNTYLDQIEKMQEGLLGLTMQQIRDARKMRQEEAPVAPAITPGQIAGSEAIPEGPQPT